MKHWILTLSVFIFSTQLFAQNKNITGRVLDPDTKEALIGASVVVKETTIGTATDINGNFTLVYSCKCENISVFICWL
jgi:hypothetical protein